MTLVMSSPFAEAEMITFFHACLEMSSDLAASVKRPVHSITISTPSSFHGSAAGPSRTARHLILWPPTTNRVVFSERLVGFFAPDGVGKFALRGVVFDEVGEVVGGNEVIDRDHFDFLAQEALFRDGAKHETSDSSKAVYADFCHDVFGMLMVPALQKWAHGFTRPGCTLHTRWQ
jgi:hypothetical protein